MCIRDRIIAVADVIKEDSPQAIKELQNMGIHVVMLTGDNERTAKAVSYTHLDVYKRQPLKESRSIQGFGSFGNFQRIKEKHGIPWSGLPGWEETREWGYSPRAPHSGPIQSGCPA